MLHTLINSPFKCDFSALLRMLKEGDDLLLLQDGVLAALEGSKALESLRQAPVSVFALNEDIQARGLSAQISSTAATISYNDFVALTVKHPQQMAW